jgi:hypothetical protein
LIGINYHKIQIDIIKDNLDKINWARFSENPAAIEILKENLEKINWNLLSYNTNAIELLKKIKIILIGI